MKRILIALLIPLLLLTTLAQSGGSGTASSIYKSLFANLATPANGSVRYCSDCQATSPCASGGTGAFANRVNGVWNCAAGGGGAPGISCSGCTVDTLTKYNGSALVNSLWAESGTTLTGTATVIASNSNGTTDLGTSAIGFKQAFIDATITAGGTTGAQTINKSAGSVNFAAAATSLVVTSNKVTASSIVMCTVATNDTTLKSVQCVPTAGSFTIFGNAAATAETRVNFWVLNQ